MKLKNFKYLLPTILYIIANAVSYSGVINHTVSLNRYDLKLTEVSNDSTISVIPEIQGVVSYGKAGAPVLPKITLHFALPVSATDLDLKITSQSSPVYYPLNFPLAIGKSVDPNSIVCLSGNNMLPYIGDLEINNNFNFENTNNYIYARNVMLGNQEDDKESVQKIIFQPNTFTTIDATKSICIGRNVQVGDGDISTNLTLITPDTCIIRSTQIKSKSKIIIYADNVVIDEFLKEDESLSRIEIYPYDKYGLNDKLQSNVIRQHKSDSQDYKPLLEQGKTWKYSLVDNGILNYPTYKPERPRELVRETRLEGYETIDGESYMKLVVYYDGADTPAENNPMYFIKEDTETGIVTFRPNENFNDWLSWEDKYNQMDVWYEYTQGTGVLYNFKATDNHHFYRYNTLSEMSVTLSDGDHKCYIVDAPGDSTWRVIEGIGLTSDSDWYGCSILGLSTSGTMSIPDSYYRTYLYEVVNADGQVIYSDDSRRPGWWKNETNSISDIVMEPTVTVTSSGIDVTGVQDIEVSLYDMQGRVRTRAHSDNGSLSISTAGMSAGVYVLRVGAHTYKVAVK